MVVVVIAVVVMAMVAVVMKMVCGNAGSEGDHNGSISVYCY
jgi:hypothetical protein